MTESQRLAYGLVEEAHVGLARAKYALGREAHEAAYHEVQAAWLKLAEASNILLVLTLKEGDEEQS